MCGITGYIGKRNIVTLLLASLQRMQNRGYDSAGIFYSRITDNTTFLAKYASDDNLTALSKLKEATNGNNLSSGVFIGMGHTRWATHGAKTDVNSHPHLSNHKTFCVVHNGIINNYLPIKKLLIRHNYRFESETDTEVIANYLEYTYRKYNSRKDTKSLTRGDMIIKSIRKMQNTLTGTWGLLIYCKEDPTSLYVTRRGSPILISSGLSEQNEQGAASSEFTNSKEIHIASELSGLDPSVHNYKIIQEDDICQLSYNNNQITMTADHVYTDNRIVTSNKFLDSPDPFPHWTLKEIYEQPDVCLDAINHGGRILNEDSVKLGGFIGHTSKLKEIDNLILLGCGSSYHAGLLSVKYFRELNNFNIVQVIDGSDFKLENIPRLGKTCLVLISQSGETRDLHNVLKLLRGSRVHRDIPTIGVVNVPNSLISREVDFGCFTNAGREVGVASTKSYISQVIVLSMIAIFFSQIIEQSDRSVRVNDRPIEQSEQDIYKEKRKEYIRDLKNLSRDIKSCIDISEKGSMLNLFGDISTNNCFVIGQGFSEAIAKEAALKIKEISYIHAEAGSCTLLKHGPFALLDENFPVLVINPSKRNIIEYETTINSCEEIKSRKAPIIYITTDGSISDTQYDHIIVLPGNNSTYAELLCIIPCQFLAYYLSIKRGINPDFPRNLAKVVTV